MASLPDGAYGGQTLAGEQLRIVEAIWRACKDASLTDRDAVIALITADTESSFQTGPAVYMKDHNSVGPFQQRPLPTNPWWGTVAECEDPYTSARLFLRELVKIADRGSMTEGQAAQAVQRSAYPDRYQQRVDVGRALVQALNSGGKPVTHALYYPPADRTTQDFSRAYPGSIMPKVDTIAWHTTEGGYAWPGYSGGSMAPSLTGFPDVPNKRILWRQHFPVNMSARALVHPRTPVDVRTNDLNVCQVELCGTCDTAGPGFFWPTAPDWALQGLADFAKWMSPAGEWEVPLVSTPRPWLAYPRSYGASAARMTASEWLNFSGHCGHQHVYGNDHGDPGSLNVARMLQLAQDTTPTPPAPPVPTPTGDDMAVSPNFEPNFDALNKDLRAWCAGLRKDFDALNKDLRADLGEKEREIDALNAKVDQLLAKP